MPTPRPPPQPRNRTGRTAPGRTPKRFGPTTSASTSFPLEAIRKTRPSATETTVGGRTGIQDRTADRECEIVLTAGTGSVYIRASDSPAAHNPPDPCTRALEAANVLVTGLP
ncbi:DUF3558 family protein [Nocardia halotolerans]|uniref:DUF3558 family protein n=1 Tax=Nocardia halotolerans TaxID=1755878 RepID=A0ABV8VFN0_9NOCA